MTEGDDGSVDTSCQKTPSQAVVEAVARSEGVSLEELRPPTYESLHSVVDPEALDAIFAPQADGTPRPDGEVSFPFCGYEVTVERDGSVTLVEAVERSD